MVVAVVVVAAVVAVVAAAAVVAVVAAAAVVAVGAVVDQTRKRHLQAPIRGWARGA